MIQIVVARRQHHARAVEDRPPHRLRQHGALEFDPDHTVPLGKRRLLDPVVESKFDLVLPAAGERRLDDARDRVSGGIVSAGGAEVEDRADREAAFERVEARRNRGHPGGGVAEVEGLVRVERAEVDRNRADRLRAAEERGAERIPAADRPLGLAQEHQEPGRDRGRDRRPLAEGFDDVGGDRHADPVGRHRRA